MNKSFHLKRVKHLHLCRRVLAANIFTCTVHLELHILGMSTSLLLANGQSGVWLEDQSSSGSLDLDPAPHLDSPMLLLDLYPPRWYLF